MSTEQSLAEKADLAYDLAEGRLRRLITAHPDQFPMFTHKGKWVIGGESWTNWCEGFLGGQLWLAYERNRDPWWRKKAEHYSRLIEPRKNDRTVHDLGFLFWSTWKRWYDLEGDDQVKEIVVQAGRTLALRYIKSGRYLRSFLAENSLFIDIMMNVGLIFYAAQETGDQDLWNIAMQHCLTTQRCLVRGDGSTAHEGIFDTDSGEFLSQSTQQGWRNDSCWARGLAWALYGFGTVYTFTGDSRFLRTAEACADYYILHSPKNGVPPNDFDEPEPSLPYESSSAAIAAGGLWNLADLTLISDKATRYRSYARRILETLTSHEFLAINETEWQGLLKHGIYHLDKDIGVDESVMWGDYFFLEVLGKVAKDG